MVSFGSRAVYRACAVSVVLAASMLAGCSEASRLNIRCMAGSVLVCTQLGDMYATGKDVPRDMARAALAYERACDGGAADVCNTLGEIVEQTGSADGGPPRAEQLFQKACDGSSSRGCLNLGLVAAAREDMTRAFALFEKSCDGGWAPGCHQLAVTYEQGEGVTKDVAKAVTLYTQACDGEYVDSCVVAANLFLAGEVVTKDMVVAVRFYGKALKLYNDWCVAGNETACTERDRLRNRLAIISEAQAKAQPTMPAVIK